LNFYFSHENKTENNQGRKEKRRKLRPHYGDKSVHAAYKHTEFLNFQQVDTYCNRCAVQH